MLIRIPMTTKLLATMALAALLLPPVTASAQTCYGSSGNGVLVCGSTLVDCPGNQHTLVCEDFDLCDGEPGYRQYCDGEYVNNICCTGT